MGHLKSGNEFLKMEVWIFQNEEINFLKRGSGFPETREWISQNEGMDFPKSYNGSSEIRECILAGFPPCEKTSLGSRVQSDGELD